MGKAVDASGHLGRPSFGLSGLGRLAEILSSEENWSCNRCEVSRRNTKTNGLTMGDRDNCSDWHQIISLNAAGVRILACSWSLREIKTYTATACVSSIAESTLIPPRVGARERSTTKRSSFIGIGAELLLARTSERSPIVPNTRFTGRLLESSCPPIADSSQSRHSTALDHPTFLVDWARCIAPACSNIKKITHRSRHPFHQALILRRLVLPRSTLRRSTR